MTETKKSIAIFGATSDMAMAIGREFAQKGFDLILAARNVERLEPYKSDLHHRFDANAKLVEFNANDFQTHDQVIESVDDACEVAVVAFGILGEQEEAEHDWQKSEEIISANYTGVVSVLNRLAEKWKPRKSGTIIGISSVAGDRGRSSNYIYGSAKAAMTAYLDGLRNKLFHFGIHVITVKPGFVASKMTSHLDLPPKLTSSPEQVGKAIFKAYRKKKNSVYIGFIWKWIMLIIKSIPEPTFKKLKM